MAIVGTATPIPDSQRGEEQANWRRYFLNYLVQVDSPTDGPLDVMQATGLPARLDTYDTGVDTADPTAFCISRTPRRVRDTRLAWHVECIWDSRFDEREDDDPVNEPPVIEFDGEPFHEPLPGFTTDALYSSEIVDANGTVTKPAEFVPDVVKGIVNSAGDPFDPPPTRDASHPVVTYTRNEEVFDAALAILFTNSVNNATWSGLDPRQARIRAIRAQSMVEEINGIAVPYWRVSYVFSLKFETHDIKLLNIGPRYLIDPDADPADKRRVKFGSDGEGAQTLGLLKANGARLLNPDGSPNGGDGEPTFIHYRVYRELSFDLLNIDLLTPLSGLRNRRRDPRMF